MIPVSRTRMIVAVAIMGLTLAGLATLAIGLFS